jgi:hypothetical protein
MMKDPDAVELRDHFAGIMDRRDTERLSEAEERAWRHEIDRVMDERERQSLVALTDEMEEGLRRMEQLFRRAGFRLPLVENINRDKETAVAFICAGHQYRLLCIPSFRSIPAMLKFEMRAPLTKDLSGEWGWRPFHSTDLRQDSNNRLGQQAVDYFFEKAIENLAPQVRERLNAALHGVTPTVPAAQP